MIAMSNPTRNERPSSRHPKPPINETLLTRWLQPKNRGGRKGSVLPETRKKKPARKLDDVDNDEPIIIQNQTQTQATQAQAEEQQPEKKSTKKRKSAINECSKQMRAKRQKWVNNNMCFACQEVCDEDGLKPCQCFEKSDVKGFGMIFCQDCDDDGIESCGGCGDRLCFRSCQHAACYECDSNYCENCLAGSVTTTVKCKNCNRMSCCSDDSDGSFTKSCKSCNKSGCKACDKTMEACDFCCKMVCNGCVDPRGDSSRSCKTCADGATRDYGREQEMICKYGSNYEDHC